jgi:hypothetical protein
LIWYIHGRTPLDFAIWTLTIDGIRVEGFDKHREGTGQLRALGMGPDSWHEWVCRTIDAYEAWQSARRGVAESIRSSGTIGFKRSHRVVASTNEVLQPPPPPASTWTGSKQIAKTLAKLWIEFEKRQSSGSELPANWTVALDSPISESGPAQYSAVNLYLTDYTEIAVHVCPPASALVSLGERTPVDRPFASVELFTEVMTLVEMKLAKRQA